MSEQWIVVAVVAIMLFIGSEFMRGKFAKQADNHVMARFRTEARNIVELRLPYNGQWVIAPRKFGKKGTMRYGLSADACYDDWYPRGLFKWLQVKIKTIEYIEGIPEPFIKSSLVPTYLNDAGEVIYLDNVDALPEGKTLIWVNPCPVITPTLLGLAEDEKSGEVAMNATSRISELEEKLAKHTNPKLILILMFVAATGACAAAYFSYKLYEELGLKIDTILQALGVG